MAVQTQIVPISLQGGLAQKQDPLQVQSPSLLGLENAQFNKIGQLNKRPGYNILTSNVFNGSNINQAFAIDSFQEELNLFDNQSLYSYSSSSEAWSNRGPAISLINTVNQVTRLAAAQQLNPDCASVDNINVFVWEDSRGGCRYSVIDNVTGTYIVADQSLVASQNTGGKPKAVVYNGVIYIFYTNQSVLYYQTINPVNPNVITVAKPLVADGLSNATASFNYDVVVGVRRSVGIGVLSMVISYFSLAGGSPAVKWFFLGPSSTPSATTTVATGTNASNNVTYSSGAYIQSISNYIDSHNQLWITWSTGVDVRAAGYTGTNWGTVNFVDTVVDTVVCSMVTSTEYPPQGNDINAGSGQLQIVYEIYNNSNPTNEFVKTTVASIVNSALPTSITLSKVGSLRSVGIASKPFYYNGNNFINLIFQSNLQSTYFGCFLTSTPFTIMSKVAPDNGGGLRTNGMAAECNQTSPGVFLWANLTKGRFISEDNTNFALLGVQSTISDFTNINKFNSTTFSNNLLFVGGILQSYDGVSVNEQNFHIYPEGVTLAQSTTGGGQLTTTAQYQYQVLYAWTDRFGQIQYSSPSPTTTIQLSGSNNTVTLTIPTLRLTAKQGVVIQIYRTLANGNASPNPVFYVTTSLLTPPDPVTGLGGGGILNNTTVDTVTFIDVVADSQIQANQPIYTQGGILPNTSPPSCSMISLWQDQVIIGGLEDPNSLWYSQSKNNNSSFNTVPVEFSASNVISISEVGGPISAIGFMDQNLIIFKKNAIFIQNGPGPNNAGGGNDFPDAQLITQQVGCTNPNSIILFGQGIAFQSPDKGIWLIDRNLSPPTYLGAGVDDIALKYQVSSATLDPNSNSIIFTTFNGPAMVYDYLIGQWSTYTDHEAVDSVAFQNLFTFVKSDGVVYQQDKDIFYDGIIDQKAQFYPMTITTPWISLANILGYQRIFRIFLLGTYRGPHSLNVAIGYNFDSSFTQTTAINTSLTAGSNLWGTGTPWGVNPTIWGGNWQPYIYQINPAIQQCTSFRLQISDSQIAPYNEGYSLSSLLLEVGVQQGGLLLPKTNKFGAQQR